MHWAAALRWTSVLSSMPWQGGVSVARSPVCVCWLCWLGRLTNIMRWACVVELCPATPGYMSVVRLWQHLATCLL
jgi:hypothetical protein